MHRGIQQRGQKKIARRKMAISVPKPIKSWTTVIVCRWQYGHWSPTGCRPMPKMRVGVTNETGCICILGCICCCWCACCGGRKVTMGYDAATWFGFIGGGGRLSLWLEGASTSSGTTTASQISGISLYSSDSFASCALWSRSFLFRFSCSFLEEDPPQSNTGKKSDTD